MAGVSLGGLASGLDTSTMIAQLMALEQRPKTFLLTQQKHLDGRKTAIEEVARQLRGLSSALSELSSPLTFKSVQKVASSDPTKVGATVVGPAPAGNVTIDIKRMARAEQQSFEWRATTGFEIDNVAVDLTGVGSAADAAAKINATSGMTVYAGVVNQQLVLTGKTLGKDIVVTGADKLTEDTSRFVDGHKTLYAVNGLDQDETIDTVVRPGGLPGIELTLKAVTAGAVTLSTTAPGPDADKIKSSVKAFVEAYNKSVDLLRTKVGEDKVKNPSTTADFTKGALGNDVALGSLLNRLRQDVQAVDQTTAVDTLAELGISVPRATSAAKSSPEALAGKLTIDDTKLDAAIAAGPAAVQSILAAAATKLSASLDPVVKASTGYLAQGTTSADQERSRIGNRLLSIDRRLAAREERLRAQFTAMESALNASQSQTAWLQGQLGGMSSPQS